MRSMHFVINDAVYIVILDEYGDVKRIVPEPSPAIAEMLMVAVTETIHWLKQPAANIR